MQVNFDSARLSNRSIFLPGPEGAGHRSNGQTQVAKIGSTDAATPRRGALTLAAARAAVLDAGASETIVWTMLALASLVALLLSLWF